MIEVPEDVVMASGMEVTSILAFLHENFLHFIDDGAVEDALAVADYFSQAGQTCQRMDLLKLPNHVVIS